MQFSRILIVDDSGTARMIIRKCLEIAGLNECEYTEACDGVDALAKLARSRPDLIVTDINMPRMDGNELILRLKSDDTFSAIPVIVISSISEKNIQTDLVYMGKKGIIKKPISPARIKELLDG